MRIETRIVIAGWIGWLAAIAAHGFRQPRRKTVVSSPAASRAGFLLQSTAAVAPWLMRQPPCQVRDAAAMALIPASVIFGSLAVQALGKHWRVPAALIADHQLVRTGPYRLVRHPVYLSFFGMTMAGALVATGARGTLLSIALFVAGTEIRVRAEERLLAARFGPELAAYQASVPAYLPLLR
jgi:protein-S-isoprenylcysteine O-methyltransferase Ste14